MIGYMNAETRRDARRVSHWEAIKLERATRFVSEAGAQRLRATICLEEASGLWTAMD
jgi:hypothetical protein